MSESAPHAQVNAIDPHGHAPGGQPGDIIVHPVPMRVLLGVFSLLILFTFLTVAASWIDVGVWNIWLALLIAVIKGSLVALYFMHLRWDSPFNGVILVAALFFVALFVGSVVLDSSQYQANYVPPQRSGSLP